MSWNSEVEKGIIILKGDIQHNITAKKPNFTQQISSSWNKVLFLGNETLYLGRLFNWFDFLQHLRNKGTDQIFLLWTALDIYHGEIKGYSGVPIEKDEWEQKLKPKMMQLIEEGVSTMVQQSKLSSSNPSAEKP